ncbi:MAG: class I SAM-dependent methyltransferase [Deltaproteobacteria bacterium]|nr:class I SAM-dependent methyltransferase [Deltaproteobacteria bacterium]
MIEHISDTARWVAVYRALESERPDALFNDPFAALLAGEAGRGMAEAMPGGTPFVGWAVVVRTKLIDDVILRLVREERLDGVVNLAAGLDTRPYRLDLPADFRWIEVDLPGITDYKEAKLAGQTPVCRLERLRLDLARDDERERLLKRLGGELRRALVLTEGILMYLTVDQVEGLAADLLAQPGLAFWMQDYVDERLLKVLNVVWRRVLGRADSQFRFFSEEGLRFFSNRGWKTREYLPLVEHAGRLKRDLPLGPLVRAAEKISPLGLARKSSGILLLQK